MQKPPINKKFNKETGVLLSGLNGESLLVQLHSWLRCASFDFSAVLPYIHRSGNLLDFGCGFGLFSARAANSFSDLHIIAYDSSQEKVTVARRFLRDYKIFVTCNFYDLKKRRRFQTIVVLDVLYLLPEKKRLLLMKQLIQLLSRKGKLLITFVPKETSWRYYLAWIQEWVMVKLIGKTHTTGAIDFETLRWMRSSLKSLGLSRITFHALPTPWPFFHHHVLVTARKDK